MFAECINLKSIYIGDGWNTSKVPEGTDMFKGCPNLTGGQGTKYDPSFIDKTRAHNDDGESNPGYLSRKTERQSKVKPEAYVVLKDSTLTFFYGKNIPEGAFDVEHLNKEQLYYNELYFKEWTYACSRIKTVVFDSSFKEYKPKSCSYWFDGCINLTSIKGIKENLNTSEVTDMAFMFRRCGTLTSLDLSGFNTENVTDMRGMFKGCINLKTIDVGDGWNTSDVTESYEMFDYCRNLMGGKGTKYEHAFIGKTRAHIDGGESNPGYFTKKTK